MATSPMSKRARRDGHAYVERSATAMRDAMAWAGNALYTIADTHQSGARVAWKRARRPCRRGQRGPIGAEAVATDRFDNVCLIATRRKPSCITILHLVNHQHPIHAKQASFHRPGRDCLGACRSALAAAGWEIILLSGGDNRTQQPRMFRENPILALGNLQGHPSRMANQAELALRHLTRCLAVERRCSA